MMKEVITKDGSVTFFNECYHETYHSTSGALKEAFRKFAEPCNIAALAKRKKRIEILDVCFGLGYNSLAAIHTALQANPACSISIVALESDSRIFHLIKKVKVPKHLSKEYNLIKKLKEDALDIEEKNIHLYVLLGDARITITTIDKKFDAVFLDPFSPKKNPELWTREFFEQIKKRMKKNACLATYSCAGIVRRNLRQAGFVVKDGPCVGRRSPSTIAVNR